MIAIHYFEKNTSVLSQCLQRIPEVDESIRIKGRNGKVINVIQIEENKYHVHVILEKLIKKELLLKDDKKKRR
ncbi:hypothetical protein LZ480_11480 [Solibacillus sp. MA9]|uniref:Preprotein translocase subunit SecA n=1 Tax=Solibacillus palustris TaxID=2908203 RepID=A0ABS9UE14_9BACL|nr:hypothetical protein [Solibacillus sp. MA9]MCH7322513.1 hypothetical protein [Solibacillus sp. MA9]